MFNPDGISVRRSERHEVVLPISIRISGQSTEAVRFREGLFQEPSLIRGDLIDLSRGGVGLMVTEFLPVGFRGEFRIHPPGSDADRPLLISKIRVQRTRMTDSRPAYFLGAAFVDIDAVFEHDLEMLLNRLRGEEAA